MMKYFIYTMTLNKNIPTFPVYLRYLKRRVYIENLIAYNQDKVNAHNKKYEQLNQIIEIYVNTKTITIFLPFLIEIKYIVQTTNTSLQHYLVLL